MQTVKADRMTSALVARDQLWMLWEALALDEDERLGRLIYGPTKDRLAAPAGQLCSTVRAALDVSQAQSRFMSVSNVVRVLSDGCLGFSWIKSKANQIEAIGAFGPELRQLWRMVMIEDDGKWLFWGMVPDEEWDAGDKVVLPVDMPGPRH
jgi:hypothetical protein